VSVTWRDPRINRAVISYQGEIRKGIDDQGWTSYQESIPELQDSEIVPGKNPGGRSVIRPVPVNQERIPELQGSEIIPGRDPEGDR
jgi:hypothetical protein